MIPVQFVGVRVEVPSNQPIVLLREAETGARYLPIFIGSPEATAIVYAYQGMQTPRPMTHDLFREVLDDLGVSLEKITVTELKEGVFHAELELNGRDGVHTISSRPSDAIALAARTGSPIYATEDVLDEAGYLEEPEVEEAEEAEVVEQFKDFLDSVNPEDFAS